ncbi:MAG: DUF4268 domain-containing protein [Bryobacterales bacterium]|nr:DUF4268 domain-containing protein [Bryobacterales bacterium]
MAASLASGDGIPLQVEARNRNNGRDLDPGCPPHCAILFLHGGIAVAESLGQLISVDIRKQWPNEAVDFTPWLAREDNIAALGNALGLELETDRVEVPVGPYSADILARDSTGDYVVVENQLSKTDHDHLGKSITYASVLGAKSVVWVAPFFTDEHHKALDWLNDHTTDELAFYGVQIELWSIDGSKPAVRFNAVSRPAEIVRQATATKSGDLSDTRRVQLAWWTAFREALLADGVVASGRTPRPQYWYDVPLGRTGIVLSNTANTNDGQIGVRVYLRGRHGGDLVLERLLKEREEIEDKIGKSLQWNPNPENRDKTIGVYRDADLSDRALWDEHLKWMVDMTSRFRSVFGPLVRGMDLSSRLDVQSSDDDATQ